MYSITHVLQTFVFPDNVAYPFGGEGFPEYLVMELHYDNPNMRSGKVLLLTLSHTYFEPAVPQNKRYQV